MAFKLKSNILPCIILNGVHHIFETQIYMKKLFLACFDKHYELWNC